MTVIEEISELFEKGGATAYFGEDVTQLEHSLQAANCAMEAKADDELVVAALLHDIGHLLGGNLDAELGVIDHHRTCVEWLRQRGFSDRLITLISGHVDAKRYLVTKKCGYLDKLSVTSKRTLVLQGGLMTPEEADAFESNSCFADLLRLRAWDEQAKMPGAKVPGFDEYRARIAVCLQSD